VVDEMTIKLDDSVVCEIMVQQAKGGVTYAIIRPDGRSEIYAKRTYLVQGLCSILKKVVRERLGREEKFNAAAS
jgi:predicted RecB family endonuclease